MQGSFIFPKGAFSIFSSSFLQGDLHITTKKCNPTFPVGYPFHISQKGYGSITGIGLTHRPRPIEQTRRFKTAEFFAFGKNSFQLSYLEISKTQGSKSSLQKSAFNRISKTATSPKSAPIQISQYKALLDGRNIYHLTQKGRKELNISRNIPQSIYNLLKKSLLRAKLQKVPLQSSIQDNNSLRSIAVPNLWE